MPVLGIDPGKHGGIALLHDNGAPIAVVAIDRLGGNRELCVRLMELLTLADYVIIERVGFIKGDGGMGAFSFGYIAGLLEACCMLSRRPMLSVPPQVWQARLGCLTGGNKDVTVEFAQRMYPGVPELFGLKKDALSVADALLIAEYGRRAGPPTSPFDRAMKKKNPRAK